MQSHDILYVVVLRLEVTRGLNEIEGGSCRNRRQHQEKRAGDNQFYEGKAFAGRVEHLRFQHIYDGLVNSNIPLIGDVCQQAAFANAIEKSALTSFPVPFRMDSAREARELLMVAS